MSRIRPEMWPVISRRRRSQSSALSGIRPEIWAIDHIVLQKGHSPWNMGNHIVLQKGHSPWNVASDIHLENGVSVLSGWNVARNVATELFQEKGVGI